MPYGEYSKGTLTPETIEEARLRLQDLSKALNATQEAVDALEELLEIPVDTHDLFMDWDCYTEATAEDVENLFYDYWGRGDEDEAESEGYDDGPEPMFSESAGEGGEL